jgi:hypothetical protein
MLVLPFERRISRDNFILQEIVKKNMEEIVETVVRLGLLNDEQPSLVRSEVYLGSMSRD